MRRWMSIPAFGLILLALPVWAQRHGGGGGTHVASGGGFAAHSSAGPSLAGRSLAGRSFAASRPPGSIRSGSFTRNPGVRRRIETPSYHRRAVNGRRSHYPYGLYYPYLGYYGYADPLYDAGDRDSYAESPAPYAENDESQRDVAPESVEAGPRTQPGPEPVTALVFRDHHVEEVRNYAIAGGTLWILDQPAAKRIPLTDLDLVATVEVNDTRGVGFQVPK